METLRFVSDDLSRTEEFLSGAYAKMRVGSTAENTHTRVSRDSLGSLSMDRLDYSFDMSYDVHALGRISLAMVLSGTLSQRYPEPRVYGPGDAFLFAPPEQPYGGDLRAASFSLTLFDPSLLAKVAAAEPARKAPPIHLLGCRPAPSVSLVPLRRTLAYLRDDVLGNPSAMQAPLVAAGAAQLLAATVLATFPSNALASPTAQDRNDAHTMTLRRALAYIEENLDRGIAAADIADAASVTPRAVQLAFRRHLGITPTAYLRRARLSAAHDELRAATPDDGVTVAAIAHRWGFASPSRFARHYRAMYGVSPRTTLRE
jgi:AraC-like DNA-binding protein